MKRNSNISGIILAGGRSSRMGRDKALLEYRGKTFIEILVDKLNAVFEDVFIISDRKRAFEFAGVRIFEDIYKNRGPMGGIHSALKNAPTDRVFVVPCDMPLLNMEIAKEICARITKKALVVRSGEALFPACGFYDRTALGDIETALNSGDFSLHGLFVKEGFESVDIEEFCLSPESAGLMNINSVEDYEKL